MPAERIAMRQVRDVLRLNAAGVPGNEIARRVGVAPSTVRLTLKRLAVAGLGWPLPAETTDAALEAQLFTAAGKKQGHRRRTEPDWAAVHRELKRKHVTLQMRHGCGPIWSNCISISAGYRNREKPAVSSGHRSRSNDEASIRGTHQGQQSTRTAPTGRTHDCKRRRRHAQHNLLQGGGHPHMKGGRMPGFLDQAGLGRTSG
jgi:IS30 family transposase